MNIFLFLFFLITLICKIKLGPLWVITTTNNFFIKLINAHTIQKTVYPQVKQIFFNSVAPGKVDWKCTCPTNVFTCPTNFHPIKKYK